MSCRSISTRSREGANSNECVQMKSSNQCAYLAGEGPEGLGPVLRHVGVFLCADELRGRGVYGLHIPMRQRRAALGSCFFDGSSRLQSTALHGGNLSPASALHDHLQPRLLVSESRFEDTRWPCNPQ